MNRFCAALVLVFFLGGAALADVSRVSAQSASELRSQIAEHNEQIQELQAEIAKYQKELETLGKQKNTLQSTVNTLAVQQKQLATEIQVTERKIRAANLKISELTLSIGNKEETIKNALATIGKMLQRVAENESVPLVARILGAKSFGEAWAEADHAVQVNRAFRENIKVLESIREELTDNRDEVSKTKTALVSLQNELSTQKRSVDATKKAQQDLLTQTKNQEANYQKLLADKRAEEATFQAALFELASQLDYIVDPSRIPPVGSGVLRWPVDDVFVTQQFGKTSFSGRLYASGTHDGVDFRTKTASNPTGIGTPIRAAGSGAVHAVNLGAVPNCQYGKWVLIKHGNGLATLYAHLSEVQVGKGKAITRGEVIGYSGNTGYAVGPHLHFGVYLADAVALKQYTCKSGYTVTIPIAPINGYLNPMSYL